jgi:uncharacterized protein (DUF433 family)
LAGKGLEGLLCPWPTLAALASWQKASFGKCVGRRGAMEDVIRKHIEKTPGVCGGKARIAGHHIRVMDIVVWHELRGRSPAEIVDMLPGITLADVYAALAYYFDNQGEIQADFRRDEEWAQWVEANIPSKLPERLRG